MSDFLSNLSDEDFIDVEILEEVKTPFFDRTHHLSSSHFPISAWLLSNFGVLGSSVWWGYYIGYYPLVLLPFLAVCAVIDFTFVILIYHWFGYIFTKLIDVLFEGLRPFAKVIGGSIASLIVFLFLYSQGWDGLLNIWNWLWETLGDAFGGAPKSS